MTPSPQARAVQVTQADRELFISLWEPTDELAEDVRNGRAFTGEVEEIARHRAQAEADALEMAALTAESRAPITSNHAAYTIAAAIRAMKGQADG